MLSYCHKFSKYTSGTCVIVASRKVILSLMFFTPSGVSCQVSGIHEDTHRDGTRSHDIFCTFSALCLLRKLYCPNSGNLSISFLQSTLQEGTFLGYCLRRGIRLYSVPLPSQGRLMIFQGIHLCLCFSCFKTTTLFLIRILGKGLHFEHNLLIHVAQSFTTYFLEVFTEHR